MVDRKVFFDRARTGTLFGPTLSQDEVDGCAAILDAMTGSPLAYTAYALATAYLETSHTMRPIEEFGGDKYFFRMYDKDGNRPDVARMLGNSMAGDGVRYHGRGYVQLTGRSNYVRAFAKLGVDFVNHPELALHDDNAAKIMRQGMTEGWFTGKRFGDYLPTNGTATFNQFVPARRIINGIDRATDIAGYAIEFQAYLS